MKAVAVAAVLALAAAGVWLALATLCLAGGLTPLLFVDNVEFWASVLSKFEQHIGYRK